MYGRKLEVLYDWYEEKAETNQKNFYSIAREKWVGQKNKKSILTIFKDFPLLLGKV